MGGGKVLAIYSFIVSFTFFHVYVYKGHISATLIQRAL